MQAVKTYRMGVDVSLVSVYGVWAVSQLVAVCFWYGFKSSVSGQCRYRLCGEGTLWTCGAGFLALCVGM